LKVISVSNLLKTNCQSIPSVSNQSISNKVNKRKDSVDGDSRGKANFGNMNEVRGSGIGRKLTLTNYKSEV
jgi:hypothetical protein